MKKILLLFLILIVFFNCTLQVLSEEEFTEEQAYYLGNIESKIVLTTELKSASILSSTEADWS
jgi:hypothetical protein